MTKRELKAVKECKSQIELDLMFITKARKEAQDAIDQISTKAQAITTRLINLEEYLT